MGSILSLISNSFYLFSKLFKIDPSTLSTISMTIVSCMFNSFFSSLLRFKYLFTFLLSLIFTLQSAGTALLLLSLFTPLEFFTSALADSLSLEFVWQQVSSSLQDSSQYSGRSQQCCSLDAARLLLQLPSPPGPLIIPFLLCLEHQSQVVLSSTTFSIVFSIPSKVEVLILLFTFFQFYSVVSRYSKVYNFASSLSFLLITKRSGFLDEIRWSVCMSKSHRSLCVSFSRTAAGLCIYHLFVWSNLLLSLSFTPLEFFTSVLSNGFSVEFE